MGRWYWRVRVRVRVWGDGIGGKFGTKVVDECLGLVSKGIRSVNISKWISRTKVVAKALFSTG
jgi:hypothetical protein